MNAAVAGARWPVVGARGSLLVIGLLVLAFATPCEAGLTGAAELSAVYESILDARFDRADEQLKHTCPPAPAEACQILGVVSLWWRIQINPENRTDDRLFSERAAAAIGAAERWTKREPQRAEAWFYVAGAYAPLVQWQILRGERVSAARNGNRIRVIRMSRSESVAMGVPPSRWPRARLRNLYRSARRAGPIRWPTSLLGW